MTQRALPLADRHSVRAGMAAALLACASATVLAGAQDDFQRGQLAYQRGDVAAAMGTLRAAASQGHAPAQTLLAHILDHADFPEQAASLYGQAALQGDAQAHAGLANLYLTGRGIAKDEKKALAHFSKAAELGDAGAIQVMADAHLRRLWGLGSDPSANGLAVDALLRAAEQGYLPAVQALSKAYRDGDWGLHTDLAKASWWQTRATELGRQRSAAVKTAKP